ncbi:ATP-binding protein [Xylella fastidiosa]|uniref:ATP-binding protein n=1 Tax=Xylella fastidiosa TaxID=2371 RepID=UPI0034DFA30C
MRGDQVKLHQVLSNLVGNAIKFTERGRINVKLRLIGENGTHHIRRFEVHDTGICISSEQQIRLFSSFSQADTSTTRLYGSTALGLAWLGLAWQNEWANRNRIATWRRLHVMVRNPTTEGSS